MIWLLFIVQLDAICQQKTLSQDKVNTQNLTIPGLQLFYPVWGRYMAVPPQVL